MFDDHYVQFEKDTSIFERLATYSTRSLTVTGVGDPLQVSATRVTPRVLQRTRCAAAIRPLVRRESKQRATAARR